MNLSERIKEKATETGFDACGIARIAPADTEAAFFDCWIREGNHAGMKYMENYRDLRLNPAGLLEGARSVISVALNYYPERKLPDSVPHIAYYAYGKDYHDVLKKKLRELWQQIRAITGGEARVFTDSAPLLERYWAWKAGLGWIGKNTQLILPGKGSYFFLGEIVTTLELEYDTPLPNRCGHCTRCLEACPTGALNAPGRLNAAACLSYLTIENKEEIPPEQAALLGNRLYGCDTCQQACPWNRFAVPTPVEDFHPAPALFSLDKERLKNFSRDDYNRIFAGSAVKRAKYEGLIRTIRHLKD